MPAWPRSCVTAAAPCRESMSRRQRNLRVRSSTKPRGIVSGPDFVPLSGSDHAVSIARSVNASSSHGRPAGCRAPRPQRRPVAADRCSNGQAVHMSGAHRPLPPLAGRARGWRSRDTSRTVRAPLPHHSTACRSDRPSSADHCLQRIPGAPLRVADRSVAFIERGQHGDRKNFEPAFPVGTFLTQYRLGIQRRPTRRLPHRLMTRHSTSPRKRASPDPSHRPGIEWSCQTIWSCFTYPRPISRSAVPHTPCTAGK